MRATVVDASAVAAVLFDEPEPAPVLASVSGALIVPNLIRYELASVCNVKTIRHPERAEETDACYRLLGSLALAFVEPDWDHLPALAALATFSVRRRLSATRPRPQGPVGYAGCAVGGGMG